MSTVTIVVPIYNSSLSSDDKISLDRLSTILGEYKVTIVHPEGLDLREYSERYEAFTYEAFDRRYFSGRKGYDRLMLSTEFYERFLAWDYILIHRLDCFVLRDELQEWCAKGYDYIGSAWLYKSWHRTELYHLLSNMKSAYFSIFRGIEDRHIARGRVGSGGFSLRRTRTMYDFLIKFPNLANDEYISKANHPRYYEDVFWSVEPLGQGYDFNIPKSAESIMFSFDENPELAYLVSDHQLPFGCRGFNRRKYKKFWGAIVEWAIQKEEERNSEQMRLIFGDDED